MATVAQESRRQKLQKLLVSDIEMAYRNKEITAEQRNKLVREKAHNETTALIDDHGYFMAIYQKSLDNIQKGWDNIVKAAQHEPTVDTQANIGIATAEGAKDEVYYVGLAVWGQIQVLTSVMNAFGEVNGAQAERMALHMGASPGLAKVIGITTDVGSGAVPVGGIAKSGAQGVQKLAGKLGKNPKQALFSEAEIEQAKTILAEGLKAEGVKDVEKALGTTKAGEASAALGAKAETTATAAKAAQASPAGFADLAAKYSEKVTIKEAEQANKGLAKAVGIDMGDLKKITDAERWSSKAMYGYLRAMQDHIPELGKLSDQALKTGASEDYINLMKYASEMFTSGPGVKGSPKFMEMLSHWDPDNIAKGDMLGAMNTFAQDMAQMVKDPKKMAEYTAAAQAGFKEFQQGWWPKAREHYNNLLLPFSTLPTFMGNTIAVGQHVAERFTGAIFGTGGTRPDGAYYFSKGMTLSLLDAGKEFGKAFKSMTPEEASRFDFVPHAVGGTWGRIINAPTDAIRGMDNFFKFITNRASLYADAIEIGQKNGLKGAELGQYVTFRTKNPTEAMLARAESISKDVSFQNDLGKIATGFQTVAQAGPLALWFPFMKSGINLAKWTWNRTPGLNLISQQLYADIAAGGSRADMAIGRLTMSYLQAHMVFELAKEGFITGSGPTDPALRKAWLATHEPYSIATPFKDENGKTKWMPLPGMEPASEMVGMVADFAQIADKMDTMTWQKAGMAIAFAGMKNMANNTWWRSVDDLVDVVQGVSKGEVPTQKATEVAVSPVINVASGGTVGQRVARIIDPTVREAADPTATELRQLINLWAVRTPGFSKYYPPERDGYADPIVPPQSVGNSWFGLLRPVVPRMKAETDDPIKTEGDRLQVKLPNFQWTIGGKGDNDFDISEPLPGDKVGVEMTPLQRDRWQELYGQLLRHPQFGIQKMVLDNPVYKSRPWAGQRQMFQDAIADYKASAKEELLIQDGQLGKKVLLNDAKQYLPLLNLKEKGQAQEGINRAADQWDKMSETAKRNMMKFGVFDDPNAEQPQEMK